MPRARQVGKAQSSLVLSRGTPLPKSPQGHQSRSSLTPSLLDFLWGVHYTGVIVKIISHW